MPSAITVDQFLARVKARAQVPTTDGRLSDTEIGSFADDLIEAELGLSVYDADDGRWAATAADVSVTAGRATYRIPSRAWAGSIDQVSLIDAQGNEIPLVYVDRSEVALWSSASLWSDPRYTLEGDAIRLLPTPADSAYSLRVRYIRRPSRLVTVSSAALISAVGASALTVASYPAGWSSLNVDVVRGEHHADPLEDDVTVTASAGTTLTRGSGSFATSGTLGISAGDYACEAGTTCVLPVPSVAVRYLVDLTAYDVCTDLADSEGAAEIARTLEMRRKRMEEALARRSRTAPKVIARHSPLRSAGMGSPRSWRGR